MADKRKAQSPFKDRPGGLGGLGGIVTSPFAGNDLLAMAAANAGPQMQTYEPSWRERLGNLVFDYTGGMGGLGGIPNRMRNEAMIGMDFIPGVGEALGGEEAGRALGAGNYLEGSLGLAATALGAVPVVGDAAAAGVKKGIRAFHGSPHDFNRFSLDKIGTGEGAQAYGHGLYFAENEGVAQSYRDALSGGRRGVDPPKFKALGGKELRHVGPDHAHDIAEGGVPAIDKRLDEIRETLSHEAQNRRFFGDQQTDEMMAYFQREMDELEALKAIGDTSTVQGAMYEVQINADPGTFLDWDKPVSGQPDPAKQYFKALGARDDQEIQNAMVLADMTRGDGRMSGFSPKTTEELRAAGVPGIKYLDQGSRGGGDGSRNYVVFDDSLIEIVRKYGLAAAIGAGVITEEMGHQMQAQGDI